MELASVIVPVYNVEKYVGACIESILKQTCENIEILLVDDGAKDSSGKICDSYAKKDKRIRVIHKENGGLSDARNTGAAQARGKYLFFVDGDDSVSPFMVEKAVNCAEKLQADMVFFDFESIEEETGRRDRYHYGLPEDRAFNAETNPELFIKSPSACCSLYKKEFWDQVNIQYPKGIHYEDLATTPRLALCAKRIGYVGSEPFYFYMLRKGSIMRSSNFERSYQDRTYVLNFLKTYFQEQKKEKTYRKELEYMFFEHGYFIPSKEIILENPQSRWIKKFREFISDQYPDYIKNPYIRQLSKKDRVMLFLMQRKMFGVMNFLSKIRKKKDSRKREK